MLTRFLLTGVLLAATPALAQDRGPRADLDGDGVVTRAEFDREALSRFTAIDTDTDLVLTREELRAYGDARRDGRRAERFGKLDANGDGFVSEDEYAAAGNARDAKREARRAKMRERLDVNGDGTIDDAERAAARDARKARRAEAGGDTGKERRRGKRRPRLDQDGDGLVTQAEFASANDALFARMDANGDGVLTKGEGKRRKSEKRRR